MQGQRGQGGGFGFPGGGFGGFGGGGINIEDLMGGFFGGGANMGGQRHHQGHHGHQGQGAAQSLHCSEIGDLLQSSYLLFPTLFE